LASLLKSRLDKQKDKLRKSGIFSLVVVICLALVELVLLIGCSPQNSSDVELRPKAAIVDQLYLLEPNQDFIDKVTADLEACGFEVDIYQGNEVSVKFYKELPEYGHKLIIFRAHAGVVGRREDSQVVEKQATYLFTGETYIKAKYIREQLTDQVLPAKMVADYPGVFAVSSRFFLESTNGMFEDTVILMMGCSTTYLSDMVAAFILKGASIYIGWNRSLSIGYLDEATIHLIHNLCVEGLTVEKAVAKTMAQVGADPLTQASLRYYRKESGNKTVAELIGRAY